MYGANLCVIIYIVDPIIAQFYHKRQLQVCQGELGPNPIDLRYLYVLSTLSSIWCLSIVDKKKKSKLSIELREQFFYIKLTPLPGDQTRAVLSTEPEANFLPSQFQATVCTLPLCPLHSRILPCSNSLPT